MDGRELVDLSFNVSRVDHCMFIEVNYKSRYLEYRLTKPNFPNELCS
jgi:hypothetical protein